MNEEEQPQQPQQAQTQTQSTQQPEEQPEKDVNGKPMVKICGACQYAGKPGYEKMGLGADEKVVSELKVVDEQIRKHQKDYGFTHGTCAPHYMQSVKQMPGITPEKLASIEAKLKTNPNMAPCLLTDEPLRHAYMRGLFTKEEIQQAAQQVQQSNHALTERFKRLAGIIK